MTKWYYVKAFSAQPWGVIPSLEASHTTRNIFSAYWKYFLYKLKYDIVEIREDVK